MRSVYSIVYVVLGTALVTVASASTIALGAENVRPSSWAQPCETKGVPNCHKVSEDLYRGAQPTEQGFANLAAMGIKTVVTLRSFHGDSDEIEGKGFRYVHIYSKPWHPEDEDVLAFLKVVADKEMAPIFVHCQHGADRTGTMVAIYRIVIQRWPKEEAIREMREGGFGYHEIWKGLIEYLEKLDVDKMRSAAGIVSAPAPAQNALPAQ